MKPFALLLLALPATLMADAPAGYYDTATGRCGAPLLEALQSIVGPHNAVGYNTLWDVYLDSDLDADGKIWDMYSTKRWTPEREQCGTYSSVGDCYNREHSMPKSWFNDASPMVTDAFHIYPTDGKVNGQRSNYPFGECAGGTRLPSHNGVEALGKLGNSTFPGYSDKVFEPDDEYKGDFARTYFYMAAAYNSRIASWDSDMLNGTSYPAFTSWAVDLLLKWHRQDPVSDKERSRNDAVEEWQDNRNPFIDHPDLAEHIWGASKSIPWGEGTTAAAVLATPADGSTVDFGTVRTSQQASLTINVRGSNLTAPLRLATDDTRFTLSRTELPAQEVNNGTTVTATFLSSQAGTYSAQLRLTAGDLASTVTLTATALDGLPAAAATDITPTSFVAHWVNISEADGPDVQYSLTVTADNRPLPGYPVKVNAADQQYRVEELEPSTTYKYYLQYRTMTSNMVTVTTADDLPELYLFPEQDLLFAAQPGVASQHAVITVEAYAVEADIVVNVTAPFEVSADLANWGTSCTLAAADDHFYLRCGATDAGTYTTTVRAAAGTLVNDDLTAQATIGDAALPTMPELPAWEAFLLDNTLTIRTAEAAPFGIYNTAAQTLYHGILPIGDTRVTLPAGVYIVVSGERARRVVVR